MLETLILAFLGGALGGAGVHFLLSWSLWRSFFEVAGMVDDIRDRVMRQDRKRAAEASVAARSQIPFSQVDQELIDKALGAGAGAGQPRAPWWRRKVKEG